MLKFGIGRGSRNRRPTTPSQSDAIGVVSTAAIALSGGLVSISEVERITVTGAALALAGQNAVTVEEIQSGDSIAVTGGTLALAGGTVTVREHQRITVTGATISLNSQSPVTINEGVETYTTPLNITRGIQTYRLVGVKQDHSARLYSPSGKVRFELRPNEGDTWDQNADQTRAQYDGGSGPIWSGNDTRTIYTYFDWMLEAVISPAEWMLIWEWHHTASSGSPPCAYILEDWRGFPNRLYAVRRDAGASGSDPIQQTNYTLIDACVPGRKYSFREEICFHPTAGKWRVWVDGVLKLDLTNTRIGYVGLNNYPEFGIYSNKYSNANAGKIHVAWFDTQPAPSYTDDGPGAGGGGDPGGGGTGGSTLPTALAYTNSLDTPMSQQELTNIDNLFSALEAAGILALIGPGHGLWLGCTTTPDGAMANCLNPNTARASAVGTVTHTPKLGLTFATGAYLNSNMNITAEAQTLLVYPGTGVSDSQAQVGDAGYTNACALFTNYYMSGVSSGSQDYVARNTTFPASLIATRSGGNVSSYVNGAFSHTQPLADSGASGTPFMIGGAGTQTTTARILFAGLLPALTGAQAADLHAALNTFRQAQAALP